MRPIQNRIIENINKMDYKKIKATHDAVTRDLSNFDKETRKIY